MFTNNTARSFLLPDESSAEPSPKRRIIRLAGLSHRSAPIEIRERFSVSAQLQSELLEQMLGVPEVQECVVLSTCNRVEVVMASPVGSDDAVQAHVDAVLEEYSGVKRSIFSSNIYRLKERAAVNHVFRVAAGLDSLVPGEPQVLGQLKQAYQAAQAKGATQALLNRLFHRAFGVAKAVRTRTRIGHNAVSVSYAAKELAEQIFGDLGDAVVMLIGAGETGALTVKHLKRAGVRRFFIVNKTLSRAAELAETVGGVPLGLDHLSELLGQADIVIGAASLPLEAPPLLSRADVQKALKERAGEPKFFIDLAVPRNFEPEIGKLSDAFLYNVDDLEAVVSRNLDARTTEFHRAQLIVDDEVLKFLGWLDAREVEPVIRDVLNRLQEFRNGELEKTLRRLKRSGLNEGQAEEVQKAVTDMADALIAKALHQPLETLKKNSLTDRNAATVFREYMLGALNIRSNTRKDR